jgi:hypothetical protein
VETDPRYVRGHAGHNETYCNILLWDLTLALGAPIPHWINPIDGSPVAVLHGSETSANGVCDWLSKFGPSFGWNPADVTTAAANANKGCPTVVVWPNPGGIGHVAMVLPTVNPPPVHIAQAGAQNLFDVPVSRGFGTLPVSYYVHA